MFRIFLKTNSYSLRTIGKDIINIRQSFFLGYRSKKFKQSVFASRLNIFSKSGFFYLYLDLLYICCWKRVLWNWCVLDLGVRKNTKWGCQKGQFRPAILCQLLIIFYRTQRWELRLVAHLLFSAGNKLEYFYPAFLFIGSDTLSFTAEYLCLSYSSIMVNWTVYCLLSRPNWPLVPWSKIKIARSIHAGDIAQYESATAFFVPSTICMKFLCRSLQFWRLLLLHVSLVMYISSAKSGELSIRELEA